MKSDLCTTELDQLKDDLKIFIDNEDPMKLNLEIIKLPFDS